MENGKTKAAVFDKAKKEGTTDGLKRALRNFGRVLGNCLQDSNYMAHISRMKVPAVRYSAKFMRSLLSIQPVFEPTKLHRRWEPPTLASCAAVSLEKHTVPSVKPESTALESFCTAESDSTNKKRPSTTWLPLLRLRSNVDRLTRGIWWIRRRWAGRAWYLWRQWGSVGWIHA